MKAADRDAVMDRFRDGELDVLVGTTVRRGGRGRARGDGDDDPRRRPVRPRPAPPAARPGRPRRGAVVLRARHRALPGRATPPDDEEAAVKARSTRWSTTTDGFVLAELDIELRREGELLGLQQSGLPPLRVASLADPAHRELSLAARRSGRAPRRRATAACRPSYAALRARADQRLAAARRRRRRAERTSSMPEAGRVIAGTARGLRLTAPGEGTRPLADRVKQALFGALEAEPARCGRPSWTCSRAAARPASRRSAGARQCAVFVERDAGRRRVIAREPAPDAPRAVAAWSAPTCCRLPGAAAPAAVRGRSAVVVDPPYAEHTPASARSSCSATSARLAGRRCGRRRQALLARCAAEPIVGSLRALSRRERFGETMLTFVPQAARQ